MANYYMYDPEKPGAVYPMKADKTTPVFDLMGGTNPNAKKNRCPRCARKMSKRKTVCKCGYTKPAVPSQAGYRVFSFFFLIFAVLAIVAIPYYAMIDIHKDAAGVYLMIDVANGSLLNLLTEVMMKSGTKIFKVIPAFATGYGGETGLMYSLSVYAFLLCGALAVVHALFAVLSREKAAKRARRALFFLGLGALLYSVSFTQCLHTFTSVYDIQAAMPEGSLFIKAGSYSFDFFTALTGIVCLFATFILWRVSKRPAKAAKKLAKKEAKAAKKNK